MARSYHKKKAAKAPKEKKVEAEEVEVVPVAAECTNGQESNDEITKGDEPPAKKMKVDEEVEAEVMETEANAVVAEEKKEEVTEEKDEEAKAEEPVVEDKPTEEPAEPEEDKAEVAPEEKEEEKPEEPVVEAKPTAEDAPVEEEKEETPEAKVDGDAGITVTLKVPSNVIYRVVGKKGSNIRKINKESKAHCKLNKQDSTYTITGSAEAVGIAKKMICEKAGIAADAP